MAEGFIVALERAGQPNLRPMLAIGGVSMSDNLEAIRQGIHLVVATPGRLVDLASKGVAQLGQATLRGMGAAALMASVTPQRRKCSPVRGVRFCPFGIR